MTESESESSSRQEDLDAMRRLVLAHLRAGHSFREASRLAGVHHTTVRYWASRDPDYEQQLHDAGWTRVKGHAWGVRQKNPIGEEELLRRIRRGDTYGSIAGDLGITREALVGRIKRNPALRAKVEEIRPFQERGRATPSWLRPLKAVLETGTTIKAACEVVGGSPNTVDNRCRVDPEVAAAVQAAAARGKRQDQSRWRVGERDDRARRAHNRETTQARRQRVLSVFEPVQRTLLTDLAAGTPLSEAADRAGLSIQAIFGRARWDTDWAERLDTALMTGRDPDLTHGGMHAYKRLGCRCPECREWNHRNRHQQT